MARKTYTETERKAVQANRNRIAQVAKDLEENRTADLDQAIAILSGYSRRNVAMILVQAEERGRDIPRAVAGFHEWRKAGRIVRKGAKGYAILIPLMGKKEEGGEGETVRGFGFGHVFDVLDTEPLAEDSPVTLRELALA